MAVSWFSLALSRTWTQPRLARIVRCSPIKSCFSFPGEPTGEATRRPGALPRGGVTSVAGFRSWEYLRARGTPRLLWRRGYTRAGMDSERAIRRYSPNTFELLLCTEKYSSQNYNMIESRCKSAARSSIHFIIISTFDGRLSFKIIYLFRILLYLTLFYKTLNLQF